jgi:hypothetical protein
MTERLDGGRLLLALGAAALLVALFLDWYGPGALGIGSPITAWTAFEITDLLLALISLAALAGTFAAAVPAARLPAPPPGAAPILGAAAFVLVAVNVIDVPPAANGASLETGAWIALGAAALMVVGGVLTVTRVSFVMTLTPREQPTGENPAVEDEPAYEADLPEEEAVEMEETSAPGEDTPIEAEDTQPMPIDEREGPPA